MSRSRRSHTWWRITLAAVLSMAGLVAACSEDDPNALRRRSAGNDGNGTGSEGTDAPPIAPSDPNAKGVAARVRRLNVTEIKNSLRDVFGITDFGTVNFPTETTREEFDVTNDRLNFGDDFLSALATVAEATGTYVAQNLGKLLTCNPKKDGEATCVGKFVDQYGYLAYRRTVTADEQASLAALFTKTRQTEDYPTSIATVVEAMVLSPNFIYRTELGSSSAAAAPLTRFEMATAISFFVLRTTPDVTLLDAAKSGKLDTRDGIVAEARRLLSDPRAKEGIRSFFLQWLELGSVTQMTKSDPAFTPTVANSMLAEATRFVDEAVWNDTTGYATIFTSPTSFIDAPLAPLYGVPAPGGTGLVRTSLDPSKRAGVFTQPGFIATHMPGENRSPITIGKFIRHKLFCQSPPPPPPGVLPASTDPNLDVRARYTQHSKDPSCAGCHKMMDPIGFGFSQYDVLGRFQPVDHGVTEDGAGELTGTDVDGAFHGPVELAKKLAQSNMAKRCFTGSMFTFALGRRVSDETAAIDQKAIDTAIGGSFTAGDLKELLVSVVSADAFLFRDTTALGNGGQ